MVKNADYMFMMDFVDRFFVNNSIIDSDECSECFSNYLNGLNDEEFIDKLICTGYIPDVYGKDSSEETMFTKLVEVMTAEWARRMGFYSECVKQKASYQDVNIKICNKIIVCDSKSFRLGRSQAAPNVKDFLKLADISKWLARYPKDKRLGGLVVYPCKHEWSKGSDAYQYCSDKSTPTLMLPYKYLAFLLAYSNLYNTNDLINLWDFEKLFPSPLKNKVTNKKEYWDKINNEIIKITNTSSEILNFFLSYADKLINRYVEYNILYLNDKIKKIKMKKKEELDRLDKETLEKKLLDLMIKEDTKDIEQSLKNINRFRNEKQKEAA